MAKILKTPIAYDDEGNPYPAEMIDVLFDQLVKLRLWSIDPAIVTPRATGKRRAHYRMSAAAKLGTSVERTERTPTHNETVEMLVRALQANPSRIKFVVNGYGGIKHDLFSVPPGTRYRWIKEPETRIWIDSAHYIQPDLLGWDEARFSAGPKNPTIVIEVVYTHLPEFKTWLELEKLSKRNHLVLFYLVRPGHRVNFLNALNAGASRPPLVINIEYFLKDGHLMKGTRDVTPSTSLSDLDRYNEIINLVFGIMIKKMKKTLK